jgi:hypothetical protein
MALQPDGINTAQATHALLLTMAGRYPPESPRRKSLPRTPPSRKRGSLARIKAMSFLSITIVCLVIGCIVPIPQILRDREEFRDFKSRIRAEMDRLRASGENPYRICTGQQQLWEIQARHHQGDYLTEDDIRVLAANQLMDDEPYKSQGSPS